MPRIKRGPENKEAEDWLSDIHFFSEGGTDAVCGVCLQKYGAYQDIYQICTNCNNMPNLSNVEW
tara:strand:- start:358 stop:549 length:192 start_codon:yes stop_codon:yes gene_type:complete